MTAFFTAARSRRLLFAETPREPPYTRQARSEHAEYNRIETARAARRFPAILELVESGAVTLTAVRLVAPHLTDANHRDVLEVYEQLRRAQDLLRHSVPTGDPAIIFERALALLLDDLERKRMAKATHPRAGRAATADSRHIPAAVKRVVWQRDNGRCAFNGAHGRCMETGFLEYHHVVPFASGGQTSESNLELRCRAHNQYESELWFSTAQRPMVREERALFDG